MADGVARVCGVISTSRSLGDAPLKRFVIPDPDVGCRRVRRGDEFLIIGTDGLWDYVSTVQVPPAAPPRRWSTDSPPPPPCHPAPPPT